MQVSAVVLSGNRLSRKGYVASRSHTIQRGQFRRRTSQFGNLDHRRELHRQLRRHPAPVIQKPQSDPEMWQ